MTASNWKEQVSTLSIDGRGFINGRRVEAAGGRTMTVTSPATLDTLGEVFHGDSADVDAAVAAAREAFETGPWARMGAAERGEALIRLADLLMENLDELALLESLDSGKPIAETRTVDIPGSAATFRWYGEYADKHYDEIPATPPGSTALVRRVPLGVVGAIIPWNYPLEIAGWKLAPALVTGNSVVIKPSEETPLTLLRLADLSVEAGIPAGVLNVVPGLGTSVGSAISRHAGVDMLTFTGSTPVAKQLMIDAGETNMKRLALEAGGKSANVIFADADLKAAAEKAAFGAFYNNGQICSANAKILVERSAHDEFVELLSQAAKNYNPTDPLSGDPGNGSLVSQNHANNVAKAIELAADEGQILTGGDRLTITGSDAYINPTIFTGLSADHHLHQTEIFGPVVGTIPFDSEDEAVEWANNTAFGLAASLWTSDFSRVHRVADRLVAGTVSVNTVDALGLTTPFGGFRQSGFGRDLSRHAINNYTDLKTTWLQHG